MRVSKLVFHTHSSGSGMVISSQFSMRVSKLVFHTHSTGSGMVISSQFSMREYKPLLLVLVNL